MKAALIFYGILNAVLYSSLLPLWEGFDEPFHYGYVQSLSVEGRLPVLNRSMLSDEIRSSLKVVPVSHVVQRNIPALMTYSQYFALDAAERRRLRGRLETLDPALRFRNPDVLLNYEAHQAPLAYILLALPDRLWGHMPLLSRILRLRLLCAIASSMAMSLLTAQLARKLGLTEVFQHAAVFLVLSSQMFYASVAHVGNDWLAIPLSVFLLSAGVSEPLRPYVLAGALASGLLTKAYFLAFVPFVAVVILRKPRRGAVLSFFLVLAVAGPWYLRNWMLYHSLSGMQESAAGVGLAKSLSALASVPWPATLAAMARQGLWTANNSFTALSSATTHLMWAVLLAAAALYVYKGPHQGCERLLIAGCLSYSIGLVYVTGLSFAFTNGAAISASPWYLQPLVVPAFCLLFCGLFRAGLPGRCVAVALVALWAYVIIVTYLAKLIPLYGGYPGRVHPWTLLRWYMGQPQEPLSTTVLVRPGSLMIGMLLLAASALAISVSLGKRITGGNAWIRGVLPMRVSSSSGGGQLPPPGQ